MPDPKGNLLPVYVLADESYSLFDHAQELNHGLVSLCDALRAEPMIAAKVRLSILGFSDDVEVRLALADLRDVENLPSLRIRNNTNYQAVFKDLLTRIPHDVDMLKTNEYLVHRPAVFFLSDGQPNDDSDWLEPRERLTDKTSPRPHRTSSRSESGMSWRNTILQVATDENLAFVAMPSTNIGTAIAKFFVALTHSIVAVRTLADVAEPRTSGGKARGLPHGNRHRVMARGRFPSGGQARRLADDPAGQPVDPAPRTRRTAHLPPRGGRAAGEPTDPAPAPEPSDWPISVSFTGHRQLPGRRAALGDQLSSMNRSWNSNLSRRASRYYLPDTIFDGWSTEYFTIRLASVRGYSHRYRGVPRQDDAEVVFHPESGTVLFAVADGVSGASESHVGATVACSSAVETMQSQLISDHAIDLARAVQVTAQQLTAEAADLLEQDQPTLATVEDLLATTLVAGYVQPGPEGAVGAIVQIGDSGAWILRGNRYYPLLGRKNDPDAQVISSAVSPLPRIPEHLDANQVPLPPTQFSSSERTASVTRSGTAKAR